MNKPLPPGEYTATITDVVEQDIGRGKGGLNVKMEIEGENRSMVHHLSMVKNPIEFAPDYKVYVIDSRNGIRVHAFKTLREAGELFTGNAAPESLIAVVTVIESARAIMPTDARRMLRSDKIELWVRKGADE